MIRRFVEWLLGVLGIKTRIRKPALESLLDLLPIIYAATVVIGIVNWFGPFPKLKWHRRLLRWLSWNLQKTRRVLIGY
ncbi:hypothetical protein LCGC14_2151210 [marine sediment metagenome]|uniref:Uncharacterized protein n=1 Tax=marine sediment metagenome TaxID=412755 RepID=A0A0F9GRV5_9ZZZZ